MTIKEASITFNLDDKEVRKRQREGMIIGVRKDGRAVVIPDDTIMIPSKKDIQSFLLQIIQFKNNPSIPLSRSICPDKESLCALFHYLYLRGFIGEYQFYDDIRSLLSVVQLTNDGICFVMGHSTYNNLDLHIGIPLQINPSVKIGMINIA